MTDKKSSPVGSDQNSKQSDSDKAAVNIIRQKLDSVYDVDTELEPSASQEIAEVKTADKPLSKHQAYMQQISNSGLSLADIQTEWHNYYNGLSDAEKHQVWQEFYAEHDKKAENSIVPKQSISLTSDGKPSVHHVSHNSKHIKGSGAKTVGQLKEQLVGKSSASANRKQQAKLHFQSLMFGIGTGLIAVIILLFGFFNERFIAPFITPSRNVTSTPIIIDGSTSVSDAPMIIIPKINVEIPVVYDEPSVEEHAVQNALERGVVHYATTPNPGEKGNAVIFGHSSNNILNKGKYKFAFVLLSKLEVGDTFYLNKDGTRFAYKIFDKKIVDPTELGVLGNAGKEATATLITCDPPGTTKHRLVVVGEQISPEPSKNIASTATSADTATQILPSNAPSLWQRVKDWFN